MSYEDCLRATYLDPESWAIAFVGLLFAAGLAKTGRRFTALAVATTAIVTGAAWAIAYYELNCVELLDL